MTISSVNPSPSAVPSLTTDTKPPAAQTNDNKPAWQPPAKSPLPPGQGTRIDQLV